MADHSPAGQELDDQAVVVRGGLMQLSDLRKAALMSLAMHRRAGVSAWTGAGVTAADIAERTPALKHGVLRKTTVKRLREAGFSLERTGDGNHVTIWLEDVTDHYLQQLVDAFDEPEPNPAAGEL